MAKRIVVNGVVYEAVGKVEFPLADSPEERAIFVDTSGADAVAEDMCAGKTAWVDGELVEGVVFEVPTDNGIATSVSSTPPVYDWTIDGVSKKCIRTKLNFSNGPALFRKDSHMVTYVPLELLGDAAAENVDEGVTFTSASGVKVAGTKPPVSPAAIEPLAITENGTYTAPDGVDGYNPVTVNVEGSGAVETCTFTLSCPDDSDFVVTYTKFDGVNIQSDSVSMGGVYGKYTLPDVVKGSVIIPVSNTGESYDQYSSYGDFYFTFQIMNPEFLPIYFFVIQGDSNIAMY